MIRKSCNQIVSPCYTFCFVTKYQVNEGIGKSRARPRAFLINEAEVETEDFYKYLGLWLDSKLDRTAHTNHLYRKGQSRLYSLRRLRPFNICSRLQWMIYQSGVAGVIFYIVAY